MKTLTIIEKFYEDVDRLGLRFPVAAISEATGFNKSNVSKVLSRKIEPSNAFLKKFYEAYPEGGSKVSREKDRITYLEARIAVLTGLHLRKTFIDTRL